MIVACSPHPYNEIETLSTLNFAIAVNSIKQKAGINVEYTVPQLLKKLEEAEGQIECLTARITVMESILAANSIEVPKDIEKLA